MASKAEGAGARACWFVGASYDKTDYQTPRFLKEGIWENGYKDKHLDLVRSIQVGDRIAIKSTFTRKHSIPFDTRGNSVSVMAIKAVGIVKENKGDGHTLKVEWQPSSPPREWYFYTYLNKVWRVVPGDWMADALISFTFENKPQDIDRFRNAPFWRERFGDNAIDEQRFKWTRFYEAVADRLLEFKDKRDELVTGIHSISAKVDGLTNLQDRFKDGSYGPMKDVCPFTVMGIFNRGNTEANRKMIAKELAKLLNISEQVPDSFEGIPVLNPQKSWFFGFDKDPRKKPDDIDALWDVFSKALIFTESENADARTDFINAYNNVAQRYGVGWNLTMGLYWIRPWNYMTLDGRSQNYIKNKLNIRIGLNGPKGRCNANDYLAVLDTLEARLKENAYPVHSFPELSLAAWIYKDGDTSNLHQGDDDEDGIDDNHDEIVIQETEIHTAQIEPYSLDDIIKDGCFIDRYKLEKILERLRTKKNLILQGPPGTGKTWLAKKLAFAFIGQRDDRKVRAVQFHPNLSYEDFVRGWRPAGEGKLTLVDGPFVEMINAASMEPTERHVVVIEEINRGNPAQIFGEMLTLLEADKRTPNESLQLSYKRSEDERIYIPDNLYVIGTMNIADRSLALVDLALRRRFAFFDLEPTLGPPWHDWVKSKCNIDSEILNDIQNRINILNNEISSDTSLGPQFRIGHSYVTPPSDTPIEDPREWFRQVVDTEIGPLLDEYWFDALDKSKKARERLLEGF